MRKSAARFAVVADPGAHRHGGAWRVWVSKNDVYLAPREMGGTVKVSLHEGCWQVAYTSDHWATGEQPNNAPGPGRVIWELDELPRVVDGVQHAWSIGMGPETLNRSEPLEASVHRIESPEPGKLVVVDVWICDPGVRRRPQFPVPPSPLALADGRLVWIGHDQHPYGPESDPPSDPLVGTMIELQRPDEPGDTPGFIVRNLHARAEPERAPASAGLTG